MFESPFPDVRIPDVSVYDFLFASLGEADLDRTALVDGTSGAEMSYGQLRAQVDLLAGALAARGVGVGDVVALLCPNVPAFATVFHGILRSGATATTVNSLAIGDEIARQLDDSGATWLLTVSPLLEHAREAAALTGLAADHLIVLDGAPGHPSLRDLLGEGRTAPEVSFDPATHVAVLPYSSGTTGRPKGVRLSHRNLVANVAQCQGLIDVTEEDRVLALLPFFHIYGMTVLLNIALERRATLVTMPRFDLTEFLRIISEHRCSYLFIAPPVGVALAKHPLVDDYDISSVRALFSGAAPLDTALGEAVARRLDARVRQGYGMTELSPVSHVIPPAWEGIPLGSIGVPIAGVTCKLVDIETGEEIDRPTEGRSAPGELWVKGPNVMLGYLGRDDATAETIDSDGFLHTGDIAVIDADGITFIVDRLKELIKYKGYQVAPAELEALLLGHPEIADAAVIGIPDEDSGEIPMAYVVLAADAELGADDVIAYVAEHTAPYKKVRRVEFIDAIPKSTSGKILRKDLKARHTQPTG